MPTLFKWLTRVLVSVSILIVVTLSVMFWLASRSLPHYDATYQLDTLSAPVEIVRDNANVPHIYSIDDNAVFYGLGFAHAQDRLWQMFVMRRTAQGRLSEVFGERTVSIDEYIRRLDIYNLSIASVAHLEPETIRALQAYSDGVNAWLQTVNEGALGRGAPEFFVFSAPISPWQPEDSVAIAKLMSLQLAGHLDREVLTARLSLQLGDGRADELLLDEDTETVNVLPEYASLFQSPMRPGGDVLQLAGALNPVPDGIALAGASNAWAAAPSRSATGVSLLANDPHLGLTAPSIWYLAHLELSTGGVIGGTIPGIPAIQVGRGDGFGWGLTSSYLDDQDIFIEQLNPDNPGEVLTPVGYQPMRERQSIIQVAGGKPVTVTLQWTDNGPVIPGTYFDLGTVTPEGHVTSLSWPALADDDTSLDFGIRLLKAKSVAEGIAAGASFVGPSQNLILADRTDIALKLIGRMPRRADTQIGQGRIPSAGWEMSNRWQGYFNYTANPEFVSPQGGMLGNTNNRLVDRPYPLHVSFTYGDNQRIHRWKKLMQAREVHTRDSFQEAQLDEVSFTARSLLPLVAADLWFTSESAPVGSLRSKRQQALAMLADWNGEMNEHLPEPLIYAAWMRFLQQRLIQDELGPLAREFNRLNALFVEKVFRDIDGMSHWCDVVNSADVESCADMARLALDDAINWADGEYGVALEALRWGDAHMALQDHEVLGGIPILRWFVNIRQSTSGGDNTLQRGRTAGSGDMPFANVHAAGYRGLYDFADPDSSLFVISTGQSGHFLSRHYDDLGEFWRRGEYVPMSLDADLARAAAVGVTHLLPGRG